MSVSYTASGMSDRLQILSTTLDEAGEVNRTGRFGWLAQSTFSNPVIDSKEINSGSVQIETIADDFADANIAFHIPFQDYVIPTRYTFTFGNGTKHFPERLENHSTCWTMKFLYGEVVGHQPVKLGTEDGLNNHFTVSFF